MRNSLDSDDKKAYESAPSEIQEGGSSREHELQEQEKGAQHTGPMVDEEKHDAQSTAESQLPPPPDGGLHAWLKVFGGFLIYINIWFVCSPCI
jgi:hypothetical protein